MRLSPRETEGLLTAQVGFLAQRRLARGVRLNHPESVALIAAQLQEFARDGRHSVAELMTLGRQFLGRRQVMPHVAKMIAEVQIEATFPDGTKLVTVHQPICRSDGELHLALYGSFLPVPSLDLFGPQEEEMNETDDGGDAVPGEVIPMSGQLEINSGRRCIQLSVSSRCDRPIQIGSHYHFIETNPLLIFDRHAAYGMRLNIPAGTSIRFEPGETKRVPLVEIGGRKIIRGGNGLCNGPYKEDQIEQIMERVVQLNFGHCGQNAVENGQPSSISRFQYALTYGPTTGDKVRLGDTGLVIEVEKDFTIYGDECKFGGGKVLREGMGQSAMVGGDQVLDTVITNALIVDSVSGIIKADIGIKDGFIRAIGKAGNPDVMDGVTPGMIVGVGTEVIAGEGKIITAGAIDVHVHFICPQLVREAIASGITTLYGGGTGPAAGTCATTCTPGANHIKFMLQATDAMAMNFGFTGKGNTSNEDQVGAELEEQIRAGAVGLKLHEDWGTTPAAIDHALRCGDKFDIQVMIHTDTLNESSCVEHTISAFKGRTIHTYHTEGAGGGHAPDILRVVSTPSVIPSSTNPTRPYTRNTLDEHLDMLMVCHHLDKNLKEDIAFAESRIRAETIAAEDILHDIGAISIISSDSQAMGRIGEVITRTWQTADKMRQLRGRLPEEKGENDNVRVRRYLAKYTVNPAVTCGMSHLIGSVAQNQLADLVIWEPEFFGAKPHTIIKGGQIAYAQMGMPNASIPTPEPVIQREMYAACGKAVGPTSVAFVSKLSLEEGVVQSYGLSKRLSAVQGCRNISKKDMILNDLTPDISVNPQTYEVTMRSANHEAELLTCPAAGKLSLAQRYFLF